MIYSKLKCLGNINYSQNNIVFLISCLLILFVFVNIPTVDNDNAFFLTAEAAWHSLSGAKTSSTGLVSYQGLIEYIIISVFINPQIYIPAFKVSIALLNLFPIYLLARAAKRSVTELLLVSLVAHFYLAPGYYSLTVGAFGFAALAVFAKNINKYIFFSLLAIFYAGFELPNPKYLFLVFIYTCFINAILASKDRKEIIRRITILALLYGFVAVFLLLNFTLVESSFLDDFKETHESTYLDLPEGRSYIAALLPFKYERPLTLMYLVLLSLFLASAVSVLSRESKIPFNQKLVYLLFIILSFGILEPTGLVHLLVIKFPLLGFIRTRAGFDIYLFLSLYFLFIRYQRQTAQVLNNISELLLVTCALILIFKFRIHGLSNLQSEASLISYLGSLNFEGFKCYITEGYGINKVFGFGSNIFSLTLNALPIDVLDSKTIMNSCKIIFFDSYNYNFSTFPNYEVISQFQEVTILKKI